MNKHTLVLASAMALAQPLLASAQARNDPALPRQAVPALRYDSAFTDYKPWRDTKPGDWRAVNDALVTDSPKGGGHASHAPATAGSAPTSTPEAPATSRATPPGAVSAPAAGGHDAHGGHGGRK